MKKYRIYTTDGIHTIECDSIKFKKSKNGLIAIPKDKKRIENVTLAMEVFEAQVVVATPQNNDVEDDDLV